MALSESIEYDKIEVVGLYKHVQVRKATVIKKDGVELTRSFERYALSAGALDASDNLVETDLSGQPAEVSAICNAVGRPQNYLILSIESIHWSSNVLLHVDVPISIETLFADGDDDEEDELEPTNAVVTGGVPSPSLLTRFAGPISASMI